MAFAIATITLILFCPESPRWLLRHGRPDDTRAVLDQVSTQISVDRKERLESEYAEISHASEEEETATLRDKDGVPVSAMRACFTTRKERYFRRAMLGVGAQFKQQLSGINL